MAEAANPGLRCRNARTSATPLLLSEG